MYGQLALVDRDTWYIAFLLVAVGSLAVGFARPHRPSRRVAAVSLTASICATWLAIAARQNAITGAIVVVAAALALMMLPKWSQPARTLGAGWHGWCS